MKIPNGIREFLVNGICISTSLREAVQMIAVLEVVFALGFMGHGAYLCAGGLSSDDIIYGAVYLFCGITYGALTWLLWITSGKPTLIRCHIWLVSSVLTLFTITALTVTRNVVARKFISSANIWIICGFFLQIYMISVVWAFMLSFQHKQVDQHDKFSIGKYSSSKQTNGKVEAIISPVSGVVVAL